MSCPAGEARGSSGDARPHALLAVIVGAVIVGRDGGQPATAASLPSLALAVSTGLHVAAGLMVAFAVGTRPLDGPPEVATVEIVEIAARSAPLIDPAAIESAAPPPPVDLKPPDMQAAIPPPPEPPPPPDAISPAPAMTLPPPEQPPPAPRFDPPPRPRPPQPVARPVAPPAPRPAPAATAAGPVSNDPAAPAGVPVAPAASRSGLSDPAYVQRLLGALERHREYPRAARERGDQGRSTLRLAIAASGALLEVRLERGSGHDDLDEAALRMARRAAPFPPLPPSLGAERATFIVPIVFALR